MLSKIKNKLSKTIKTKNFSDYSDVVNEYVQILEKNYDKISKNEGMSIDFLLFYIFIEDFWYGNKDTIQEMDNEYYKSILYIFKTISKPIKEMMEKTNILDDKSKLNDLRSKYLKSEPKGTFGGLTGVMRSSDFRKKTDNFKRQYRNLSTGSHYTQIFGDDNGGKTKGVMPNVGHIYRCIKGRKTKTGIKFIENGFYQVIRTYKGSKSGDYHVVMFNLKDMKKAPIDTYFINFQKHFDISKLYTPREVDKVIREEDKEIKNSMPAAGFVSDLK